MELLCRALGEWRWDNFFHALTLVKRREGEEEERRGSNLEAREGEKRRRERITATGALCSFHSLSVSYSKKDGDSGAPSSQGFHAPGHVMNAQ